MNRRCSEAWNVLGICLISSRFQRPKRFENHANTLGVVDKTISNRGIVQRAKARSSDCRYGKGFQKWMHCIASTEAPCGQSQPADVCGKSFLRAGVAMTNPRTNQIVMIFRNGYSRDYIWLTVPLVATSLWVIRCLPGQTWHKLWL